jgi:hypothetical protein
MLFRNYTGASSQYGDALHISGYNGVFIYGQTTGSVDPSQQTIIMSCTYKQNGTSGITNTACVGIGTTNPSSYTLQVVGTIGASGDITALYSDERLKIKTGALTGALAKVRSLDTFTYRNNELAKSFGFKDDYQRVGISAQQVQKVLPEAVRPAPFDAENQSGQNYLTVQYEKLVPLLIEALKEEHKAREELESRIKKLEVLLNRE